MVAVMGRYDYMSIMNQYFRQHCVIDMIILCGSNRDLTHTTLSLHRTSCIEWLAYSCGACLSSTFAVFDSRSKTKTREVG
jgi:hypothetical protein